MPDQVPNLIAAVRANDTQKLRELLAAGGDARVVSRNGWTLLHVAAEDAYSEMMRALIEAGVPVDAQTKDGDTTLHFAASQGKAGRTNLPFSEDDFSGGDPFSLRDRLVDEKVAEALILVVRKLYPQLVTELEIDPHHSNERRLEHLSVIAEVTNDSAAIKSEMNRMGIDVDTIDPELGDILAGYPQYRTAVATLLDCGAAINAFNNAGQTPLHYAIGMSEFPLIELLRERGADPNISLQNGRCVFGSPMREALRYHRLEVVQAIYAHGGKLDFENSFPLHDAAGNGKLNFVNWLLENGGDLNQVNPSQRSPIMSAANHGHADVVEALCKLGANLRFKDERGRTVLHLAAASSDCLRPLLAFDLDLDELDSEGKSPLHIAAVSIDDKAIALLANAGAGVNLQDHDGNTALHSVFFGEESRPDIEMPTFQALIAAGVDRSIKNNKGETAFDLAVNYRYPEEYLELLKIK